MCACIGSERILPANAESTYARIAAGVAVLMSATTSRARLVAGDGDWRGVISATPARTAAEVRR